ncbi:Tetratricopeptide repeat, partial [Trinorchestia longiramus]
IVRNLRSGLTECGESGALLTPAMVEDSLKLWKTRTVRVLYSITAVAASSKDYRLCGSLLHLLLKEDPGSSLGLYSALGRLHLHLGDAVAAQKCFSKCDEVEEKSGSRSVTSKIHASYLAMAENNFNEAVDVLKDALKTSPCHPLAVNNLGVSLVYTGRVREAVAVVEGAMFQEPERLLHESLVLNLATMYELESCNATANKIKLLQLVAQHKGDSFAVAALKLH